MSRVYILPYKAGSQGANALRDSLRAANVDVKLLKQDGSTYRPRATDVIINWGNHNTDRLEGYARTANVLNRNVVTAANKFRAFVQMDGAGVRLPSFYDSYDEALEGINGKVVGRTILNGSGGDGIIIADSVSELAGRQDVKLFVEYIKKKYEYRIHVMNGQIIDMQQKKKRADIPNEEVNFQIRNHANGWIFAREDVNPPDAVKEQAIAACTTLGLSFGAVDVIYNDHQKEAYVLEVNTAPGLEGTTLERYTQSFKSIYNL